MEYPLPAIQGGYGNTSAAPLYAVGATHHPETEAPIMPVQAPFSVHYSITVTVSVLVGILFLLVYVQLIMVVCFGYKLLSYQTVLLFDILLWAALRLTLYSFYFYHCCDLVEKIVGTLHGWFLVSLPSVLQYFSLAVLVRYFGESIFKVLKKRQEMASLVPPYRKMKKYRVLGDFLWTGSVVFFLACSLIFYFLIDGADAGMRVKSILIIVRVALLDGLFLVMGITLGVCIIIIYITRFGKDILEAQGGRKCVPPLTSILLILIFASRDVYSLVAAVSDSQNLWESGGWIFVTDDGDYNNEENSKYSYIAYLLALLVWEVMPTYIIVFFFRVRLPHHTCNASLQFKPYKSRKKGRTTPTKHFFENPNRYDENEQLLYQPASIHQQRHTSTTSHVSIPSLTSSAQNHAPLYPYAQQQQQQASNGYTYGSTNNGSTNNGSTNNGSTHKPAYQPSKHYSINTYYGNSSSHHPSHGSVMPGTTPPRLFTSPRPTFFTERDRMEQ